MTPPSFCWPPMISLFRQGFLWWRITDKVIYCHFQEVERKHEAMLQMYGEKAEEAEELKLDIDDLETMYRQQVRNM